MGRSRPYPQIVLIGEDAARVQLQACLRRGFGDKGLSAREAAGELIRNAKTIMSRAAAPGASNPIRSDRVLEERTPVSQGRTAPPKPATANTQPELRGWPALAMNRERVRGKIGARLSPDKAAPQSKSEAPWAATNKKSPVAVPNAKSNKASALTGEREWPE